MVIADFGSGETCHNDPEEVRRMIDGLAAVDPKRKAVIKWQLFMPETVPYCEPLFARTFFSALHYASDMGYRTTASVFDEWSLDYLLGFDIPFVKVAARDWCYPLIDKVPRGVKVIVSVFDEPSFLQMVYTQNCDIMVCVPKYPATAAEYEKRFLSIDLDDGISDHTPDLTLWRKYKPAVYERHFKLPDSTGKDSGDFASTPDVWKEILA